MFGEVNMAKPFKKKPAKRKKNNGSLGMSEKRFLDGEGGRVMPGSFFGKGRK